MSGAHFLEMKKCLCYYQKKTDKKKGKETLSRFSHFRILAGNTTLQKKKNNAEGFTAQVVLELF